MTTDRPDHAPDHAPTPPLARPVRVARLSRKQPTPFDIEADAEELRAVAGYLDLSRVERLSFKGSIAPAGAEGWEVSGRLVARLEQTCVISLAPVPARHDVEIRRLYLPADQVPAAREVRVAPDEEDEPDTFETTIDPGALALESLALMLDPYPRAPGAELGQTRFAPPGAAPIEDEEDRPFADLAALKHRLERGGH